MNRIKELREEHHLNQTGLAMKLNTSQSLISYYETGSRVPDMKLCIQMADLFRVSLDYLVGRSSIRNPGLEKHLTTIESNILSQLKMLNEVEKQKVEAFINGLSAR